MRVLHSAIALSACLAAAQARGKEAPLASAAATGIFRGHLVTWHATRAGKLFQGDILLDHVTAAAEPQAASASPHAFGVAFGQYLWPAGASGAAEIPYVTTAGADNLDRAIAQFNATFAGVIQFVARGTQSDYVDFDFDPGNGSGQCESYVGRVGGAQSVGGSSVCSLGTLLHEMGHVAGLWHEQSRPDRDGYVTINTANVIKGSLDNFAILSDDAQMLGPYDYASVMQYIPFAFSRNGGPVMDSIPPGMPLSNQAGYTAADLDAILRLYGGTPKTVTIASNPPGLTLSVDGANVVAPASFRWPLRSTHMLAVAAGVQMLGDGSYTYGRWSDDVSASHTITVAPGDGSLARPKTAPSVTVYTANFVQLAAFSGSVSPAGAGSIAVSPAPQT